MEAESRVSWRAPCSLDRDIPFLEEAQPRRQRIVVDRHRVGVVAQQPLPRVFEQPVQRGARRLGGWPRTNADYDLSAFAFVRVPYRRV